MREMFEKSVDARFTLDASRAAFNVRANGRCVAEEPQSSFVKVCVGGDMSALSCLDHRRDTEI